MLRAGICSLAVVLLAAAPVAQTDGLLHLNDDVHLFLERQQTLGNLRGAFLDEQPLSAYRARRYLDSLAALVDAEPQALAPRDQLQLAQLRGQVPLHGASAINRRFRHLYDNNIDFFSVEEGAFRLQVNPKLYLSAGAASETAVYGEQPRSLIYQNTRALRVSGGIGDHFFFHSQLEENQRVEPMVARSRVRPRLPLAFQPDSSLFDYMLSTAALGYRDRYVEIQFGRGYQRWGHARSSMYYSNHAPPHTWLQARLEVWRLSYTAHYTVFDDDALPPASWHHFRHIKYGAFHRLGLTLPGRVSLGFFEGIILSLEPEEERLGNYIRFLNPLLFFNAVDKSSNSPGNVLVGFDAHWVAVPGLAVYTQLILDDFEAGELFFNPGYWKNTWGALLGVHVVDPWIEGLTLRAEAQRIRPYVYANVFGSLAHTHREGFLGSPAGPNSQTFMIDALYQPLPRLRTGVSAFTLVRGRSTDGLNFGEDPFVPYTLDRVSDDEVHTLQGIRQNRRFIEGRVGYEVLPALWIDGVLQHETFNDAEWGRDRLTGVMLQLRWGMPVQHPLY